MDPDEQPCDAPDPLGREEYACVYRMNHDTTQFAHRFQHPDDHEGDGSRWAIANRQPKERLIVIDPVTNLNEQRELAQQINNRTDTADREDRAFTDKERTAHMEDADRLAELVLALDEWRRKGGFDPYTA